MEKLFMYKGMVSTLSFCKNLRGETIVDDITLYDMADDNKAPIRISAGLALGRYLMALHNTDEEERYIDCEYYYDSNLYLRRIVVPASGEEARIPAKVITCEESWSEELAVFGQKEYIATSKPEAMSKEDFEAWREYRSNQNLMEVR